VFKFYFQIRLGQVASVRNAELFYS
jgi:hypothetical protein